MKWTQVDGPKEEAQPDPDPSDFGIGSWRCLQDLRRSRTLHLERQFCVNDGYSCGRFLNAKANKFL